MRVYLYIRTQRKREREREREKSARGDKVVARRIFTAGGTSDERRSLIKFRAVVPRIYGDENERAARD